MTSSLTGYMPSQGPTIGAGTDFGITIADPTLEGPNYPRPTAVLATSSISPGIVLNRASTGAGATDTADAIVGGTCASNNVPRRPGSCPGPVARGPGVTRRRDKPRGRGAAQEQHDGAEDGYRADEETCQGARRGPSDDPLIDELVHHHCVQCPDLLGSGLGRIRTSRQLHAPSLSARRGDRTTSRGLTAGDAAP